jgi:hypothetical protein
MDKVDETQQGDQTGWNDDPVTMTEMAEAMTRLEAEGVPVPPRSVFGLLREMALEPMRGKALPDERAELALYICRHRGGDDMDLSLLAQPFSWVGDMFDDIDEPLLAAATLELHRAVATYILRRHAIHFVHYVARDPEAGEKGGEQ